MSTNYDSTAHSWANQRGDQSAYGNRMFSEGPAIYSYGRHFMIAKHVTNKAGEHAVLFTTNSYSNTTAKHISLTRDAASHKHLIFVPNPADNKERLFELWGQQIKGALKGLPTARKPENYIGKAEALVNECKEYCKFFGYKVPKGFEMILENARNGKYTAYLLKEAKRIEREKKAREKKELADFKIGLLKWRKGKGKRLDGRLENQDYLRFNKRTQRVETSQNVEIPVAIAKRAFNWIKLTIQAGGCNGECKYKILDFEVSEVTTEAVKIGCHRILHTEIERIAKKLGWI